MIHFPLKGGQQQGNIGNLEGFKRDVRAILGLPFNNASLWQLYTGKICCGTAS